MRAAIAACTVSGSRSGTASCRSSRIARETSSVKNGLPPAASAIRPAMTRRSSGRRSSASRVADWPSSGISSSWVLLRAARPNSGRRSASSGRQVQRMITGACERPKAASSSRLRVPSSAQCASSTPIASGRSRGQQRDEPAPGALQLVLGVGALLGAPHRDHQRRRQLGGVIGAQLLEHVRQRGLDLVGAGIGRVPGGVVQDLAERPEGDSVSVRRAAADHGPPALRCGARRRARPPAGSCRSRPRRSR